MSRIAFLAALAWTLVALGASLFIDLVDPDVVTDVRWVSLTATVMQYVSTLVVFILSLIGFTELALSGDTRGIAIFQSLYACAMLALGGFAVSDIGETVLFTQWQAMLLCYSVLAGGAASLFAQAYLAGKSWSEAKRRAPRR